MLNGIVNRIAKIGVELEGGWDAPIPGYKVIRDGSVIFKQMNEVPFRTNPRTGILEPAIAGMTFPKYAIGEIVSPPLDINKLEEFLTQCHPQHINETCGLHVHMSFAHKLNYSRLMTPEFTPCIIQAIKAWGKAQELPAAHPLWDRVNNPHHQHCAQVYLGDKQVYVKGKDYHSRGTEYSRYTAINYCENQHHTIECRVLPMFDTASQALSAIMCVLNATNLFLSKIRQRERKVSATVLERPSVFSEIGSIVR